MLGKFRSVVCIGDFYTVIHVIHGTELMLDIRRHSRWYQAYFLLLYRTLYGYVRKVSSMYQGILSSVVEKFISLSSSCQLRMPQVTTTPLQPIIAHNFHSQLLVMILCQCVHLIYLFIIIIF